MAGACSRIRYSFLHSQNSERRVWHGVIQQSRKIGAFRFLSSSGPTLLCRSPNPFPYLQLAIRSWTQDPINACDPQVHSKINYFFCLTQETNLRILALNWCRAQGPLVYIGSFFAESYLFAVLGGLVGGRSAVVKTGNAFVVSGPLLQSVPGLQPICDVLGHKECLGAAPSEI